MRVISMPRRAGKTTEAIKLAHETTGYIVCHSIEEARRISGLADELGLPIRLPITYAELIESGMQSAYPNQALIIDNADQFFNWLVKGRHIVVGITTDIDKPNAPKEYLEKLKIKQEGIRQEIDKKYHLGDWE